MQTSWLTTIFDLIAPRRCCVCGERLTATESVLCAVCQLHLSRTGFESDPYDNEMARRFWHLIPVERAAALFYYEPQSEAATVIYDMKYHHRPDVAEHLGRIAARDFLTAGFFSGIDAIVPVPLTRIRQWHRGYNQSVKIAQGVSSVTGLPVIANAVRRISFRQSQTRLSQWQRQQNTSSAFRLSRPDRLHGKHLLLVDDIVTTGSTITSLASELQRAGDVRFSILSLGYTKS